MESPDGGVVLEESSDCWPRLSLITGTSRMGTKVRPLRITRCHLREGTRLTSESPLNWSRFGPSSILLLRCHLRLQSAMRRVSAATGDWLMNVIWEGVMVGGVLVVRFAIQIAAVVIGLVIWDRFLRRRG